MMNYFELQGNAVIFRNLGETVVVEPWGPDSARVRAVLMGDVRDDRFALLDPVETEDVEVSIDGEHAVLRVGKLTVKMDVAGWKRRVKLTFLMESGRAHERKVNRLTQTRLERIREAIAREAKRIPVG